MWFIVVEKSFFFRLPIVQGSAYAYIVPMIALTKLDRWKCPDYSEIGSQHNSTNNGKALGLFLYFL